jgi:hypothetical protein
MKRETEILLERASSVLFGIFAHNREEGDALVIRVGGTGIFINQFLALTARHISRDFWRLDSRSDSTPRGYFETEYASGLFQVHQPFAALSPCALWQVDRFWDSLLTDLTLLQASAHPKGGFAVALQTAITGQFFEWALLPPPVGERVFMLGFPQSEVKADREDLELTATLTVQEGEVTAVYESRRDRGMLNFPCFAINKPVDHGFSGGPVFWQGNLCGIVSAGSLDDSTYAASLWPACLMEYEYPGIGGRTAFGDLFERGVLQSTDWKRVRERIAKHVDEFGKPYAFIHRAG